MEYPIHIAHIVYRFDIGGIENGIVQLINHLPHERYRYSIFCLDDYSVEFAKRLMRSDVVIYALHKKPGQDLAMLLRLYHQLKQLKPDIVHTHNLSTLEAQLCAFAARVAYRIHTEHGWDMQDLSGQNRRYRWLRRFIAPFVHQFIAVNQSIADYLRKDVGIAAHKIQRIHDGVDVQYFYPRKISHTVFDASAPLIIGSTLRFQAVKDPMTLIKACCALWQRDLAARQSLRLWLIGDGPLLESCRNFLAEQGFLDLAWLPGARHDIADLLRKIDVFSLPSLAEGLPNSLLEAMACGLPVIASRVGGIPDLITDGQSGFLIEPQSIDQCSSAIEHYLHHPEDLQTHGKAAQQRIEGEFTLAQAMANYDALYRR